MLSAATIGPIAILTVTGYEQYKNDDRLIIAALLRCNLPARHVLWSDATQNWKSFRAVFIRSTWGYCQERKTLECFLDTLQRIAQENGRLINPLSTITWNLKKSYLQQLRAKGVAVLDTLWLSKNCVGQLATVLAGKEWQECVIKPVVSAGGMHTRRFQRHNAEQVANECLCLDIDEWMVQPFAPEIVTEGEHSFVFIEHKFSHCVLKKPAPGNFLVNETQGGTPQKEEPAGWMIEQATEMLLQSNQESLVTRIDTLRRGMQLILMEVECIEPLLYLETKPEAADEIAMAIKRRLQ